MANQPKATDKLPDGVQEQLDKGIPMRKAVNTAGLSGKSAPIKIPGRKDYGQS